MSAPNSQPYALGKPYGLRSPLDMADAEAAYRRAIAQAIVRAEGTAAEREAVARAESADAARERDVRAGMVKAYHESLRSLATETAMFRDLIQFSMRLHPDAHGESGRFGS